MIFPVVESNEMPCRLVGDIESVKAPVPLLPTAAGEV